MAVLPIVKVKIENKAILEVPEVLKTKCEYVKEITPEIKALVQDMLDTVRLPENSAAGLSAPQVGVGKRICVVRKFTQDSADPEKEYAQDFVLINPEITSESPATNVRWEACLSVPGIFGMVERAKRVKVTAIDENGTPVKFKAEGFFARVLQHELDHLNGVLYTSRTIGNLVTEAELDRMMMEEQKGL